MGFFCEIHFILGNVNEDLAFEYGDGTETHYGCGATLQNEFWYFGGYNQKRQVSLIKVTKLHNTFFKLSKIVGCKLERQGDLIFDFDKGSCNTFSQPDPKVLLCFDMTNTQECHM